jgi:hypothetical protein
MANSNALDLGAPTNSNSGGTLRLLIYLAAFLLLLAAATAACSWYAARQLAKAATKAEAGIVSLIEAGALTAESAAILRHAVEKGTDLVMVDAFGSVVWAIGDAYNRHSDACEGLASSLEDSRQAVIRAQQDTAGVEAILAHNALVGLAIPLCGPQMALHSIPLNLF